MKPTTITRTSLPARLLAVALAIMSLMSVLTPVGAEKSAGSKKNRKQQAEQVIKAEKIRIDGDEYVIRGKKITLKATVSPSRADQRVEWSSANDKIATVNSKGVVKGIKAGKVKITAVSKTTKKVKASFTVTVLAGAVSEIKITGAVSTLDLSGQKQVKLAVKAKPKGALQQFEWKSSNTKVATVSDQGVVKAKKTGQVTITATAVDGSRKKAAVTLQVIDSKAEKTPTQEPENPDPGTEEEPAEEITETPVEAQPEEQPQTEKPVEAQPEEQPQSEKPVEEQPKEEQPKEEPTEEQIEKPSEEQPQTEQPKEEQQNEEQPETEPQTEQPKEEQPNEQPEAQPEEQPQTGKPKEEQPETQPDPQPETQPVTEKPAEPTVPAAEEVILIADQDTVFVGETLQVSARVLPETASQAVSWSSSKKSVAKVDKSGLITAVSAGTTTIIASAGDTFAMLTLTVQPEPPKIPEATSIVITGAETLDVYQNHKLTLQLYAAVFPADANQQVRWCSSDPSVAGVDETGFVIAKQAGSVTITAEAADGSGVKQTVSIEVIRSGFLVTDHGDGTGTLTAFELTGSVADIPDWLGGLKITALAPGLFQNNAELKDLIIPAAVTEIPDRLCKGCIALRSVKMSTHVTAYGKEAFNTTRNNTVGFLFWND